MHKSLIFREKKIQPIIIHQATARQATIFQYQVQVQSTTHAHKRAIIVTVHINQSFNLFFLFTCEYSMYTADS